MDAYSVAAQLLGDMKLSSGQLGQLRALDYRLQLELHRRATGARSNPTPEEFAGLRAALISDIRDMLTPEQRANLDHR